MVIRTKKPGFQAKIIVERETNSRRAFYRDKSSSD